MRRERQGIAGRRAPDTAPAAERDQRPVHRPYGWPRGGRVIGRGADVGPIVLFELIHVGVVVDIQVRRMRADPCPQRDGFRARHRIVAPEVPGTCSRRARCWRWRRGRTRPGSPAGRCRRRTARRTTRAQSADDVSASIRVTVVASQSGSAGWKPEVMRTRSFCTSGIDGPSPSRAESGGRRRSRRSFEARPFGAGRQPASRAIAPSAGTDKATSWRSRAIRAGARSIANRNSRCVGAASTPSSTYHARKSALAKSADPARRSSRCRATLSGRRASMTQPPRRRAVGHRTQKK